MNIYTCTYILNAITIKISIEILRKLKKLILKLIRKFKSKITKNIFKIKKKGDFVSRYQYFYKGVAIEI